MESGICSAPPAECRSHSHQSISPALPHTNRPKWWVSNGLLHTHHLPPRVTQTMVSLVLETVKPASGRRVIPTISFATHRTSHSKRFELVLKGIAGVSTATIRMMHDARSRDNSIASGVTTWRPEPVSLPSAAALTPLRSVGSPLASSFTTTDIAAPSVTR